MAGGSRLRDSDGGLLNHQAGVSCFAEYSVVDRGSVVVIDKSLPLHEAAIFGCAVMTGAGAVMNTARIRVGDSVAIVGLGGVGLNGLLGACLAGAETIIAVDLSDAKLGLARQLGATHTVNASDPDHVQQVRDLSKGGVDFAFDLAGTIKAMETAYACTALWRQCRYRGFVAKWREIFIRTRRSRRTRKVDSRFLHGKLCAGQRHSALHQSLSARAFAG